MAIQLRICSSRVDLPSRWECTNPRLDLALLGKGRCPTAHCKVWVPIRCSMEEVHRTCRAAQVALECLGLVLEAAKVRHRMLVTDTFRAIRCRVECRWVQMVTPWSACSNMPWSTALVGSLVAIPVRRAASCIPGAVVATEMDTLAAGAVGLAAAGAAVRKAVDKAVSAGAAIAATCCSRWLG